MILPAAPPTCTIRGFLAPGNVHHQLGQQAAQLKLVYAGHRDVSAYGEDLGPLAFGCSHSTEPVRPVLDDRGDVHEGLDVVDDGGSAPEPALRGERRLVPRLAAHAFYRVHEGRLFSAHVSARADRHVDVHVLQKLFLLGLIYGAVEIPEQRAVFTAEINVGLPCPYGETGDGKGFYEGEGVVPENEPVLESTHLAFVRVADEEFLIPLCLPRYLPLKAAGETRSPPPFELGRLYLFDHPIGRHLAERFLKGLESAPFDVGLDRPGFSGVALV